MSNMYIPVEGDFYIQEVFTNKFHVYLYLDKVWEFQSVISKEEADKFIKSMQLMHDTKVGRLYYRLSSVALVQEEGDS